MVCERSSSETSDGADCAIADKEYVGHQETLYKPVNYFVEKNYPTAANKVSGDLEELPKLNLLGMSAFLSAVIVYCDCCSRCPAADSCG